MRDYFRGVGEVFGGKINDNYPEQREQMKHPIRYYDITFKLVLNSLFNEYGVLGFILSFV